MTGKHRRHDDPMCEKSKQKRDCRPTVEDKANSAVLMYRKKGR